MKVNLPWPWDRHLLLYYPGTDGWFQPNQTLWQTFAPLLPWDRHLLLYYPGTDGSVQPKQTLGQTLHRLAPLWQTVYGLSALGQTFHRLVPPPWDKPSMASDIVLQSQTHYTLSCYLWESDSTKPPGTITLQICTPGADTGTNGRQTCLSLDKHLGVWTSLVHLLLKSQLRP